MTNPESRRRLVALPASNSAITSESAAGHPTFQDYDLIGRDEKPFSVNAKLIGFTTSQVSHHTHPLDYTLESEIDQLVKLIDQRVTVLDNRYTSGDMSREVYEEARLRALQYKETALNTDIDLLDVPRFVERNPDSQRDDRCSACRWFEVRIFQVRHEYNPECTCGAIEETAELVDVPDDEVEHTPDCGTEPPRGNYLVLTYGLSTVPGEIAKRREAFTNSAYEVVELLTQRRGGTPFIPQVSSRALAQAANYDVGMRDAYITRAVS